MSIISQFSPGSRRGHVSFTIVDDNVIRSQIMCFLFSSIGQHTTDDANNLAGRVIPQ